MLKPLITHINERKHAEEKTEIAYAELDQIFNTAADGMRLIDKQFNILRPNDTFVHMIGAKNKEELIGKKCYEVFKGQKCHSPACPLTQIIGGKEMVQFDVDKERLDGAIVQCILTAKPFYGPDGKIIGIVENFKDISDRKRAEREVNMLKQQMEFILGATKTGLDIIDSEFNVRYIDPKWKKVYGEPAGRKCYEYFMGRSEICPGCGIPKALETKSITVTEEVLVKEGNRPIQVTTIPFQNEDGEWLVAEVNVDISERKKLEGQLLQAQKMEAIGQLAGGIAHDFNNILTAIIGYGNLLKMEMAEDEPLSIYVTQILNSAERAAKLTQALLAFSRKQIINPMPVNLNEIIMSLEKLLSRIIGEDIELSVSITDKDLIVMADRTQIEQILMNLATNARDAMPNGGHLTIKTELTQIDDEYIKTYGYGKSGFYALMSVEDTGCGMDAKTKERIFEPFFTTKEIGKGTGLGLAMVYGIVKQHEGYINVYSELGKGAIFKIYLPLIKSKIEEEKIPDIHVETEGTETILVAEDDLNVGELMKHILKGAGYEVIEVKDGESAIDVFLKNKDRIKLLVLDVIMPKKNGKEVYDEIERIKPDIKVIFTSGYNAELIHKKRDIRKGIQFYN